MVKMKEKFGEVNDDFIDEERKWFKDKFNVLDDKVIEFQENFIKVYNVEDVENVVLDDVIDEGMKWFKYKFDVLDDKVIVFQDNVI